MEAETDQVAHVGRGVHKGLMRRGALRGRGVAACLVIFSVVRCQPRADERALPAPERSNAPIAASVPTVPPPTTEAGPADAPIDPTPVTEPGRSPEEIDAVIAGHAGAIDDCLFEAAKTRGAHEGHLVVWWTIDGAGRADGFSFDWSSVMSKVPPFDDVPPPLKPTSVGERALIACMRRAFAKVHFAPSPSGARTVAQHTLGIRD